MVVLSSSKRNILIRHRCPRVVARAPCAAVPSALTEFHAANDDLRHIAFRPILRVIAARLDAPLDGDLLPL